MHEPSIVWANRNHRADHRAKALTPTHHGAPGAPARPYFSPAGRGNVSRVSSCVIENKNIQWREKYLDMFLQHRETRGRGFRNLYGVGSVLPICELCVLPNYDARKKRRAAKWARERGERRSLQQLSGGVIRARVPATPRWDKPCVVREPRRAPGKLGQGVPPHRGRRGRTGREWAVPSTARRARADQVPHRAL